MTLKYKISEVAKLLGITTEAIRYYENQDIISPTKSESSGYRYYDVWDLHILIRARAYRQYGYSLSETAELINHYNITDIVSTLSKKEEDIKKEIIWNINLLKHIRQMQNIITEAGKSLEKYRIEYRPPIYRIDVQDGYELYSDAHHLELYNSWIDKVPFVFPSAVFQKGDIENWCQNFSFGLGLTAGAGGSAYTATKHAMVDYTKQLCLEFAPKGIRINGIAPGSVATPLIKASLENDADGYSKRVSLIPMGRLGEPDDIASMTVYLASDEADFINGAIMSVDGGRFAKG